MVADIDITLLLQEKKLLFVLVETISNTIMYLRLLKTLNVTTILQKYRKLYQD